MAIGIDTFIVFSSFVFALFIVELVNIIIHTKYKVMGGGTVWSKDEGFLNREIGLISYFIYVISVGIAGVFIQNALTKYMILQQGYLVPILVILSLFTYIFAILRIGYAEIELYDGYIVIVLIAVASVSYKWGNTLGGILFLLGALGFFMIFIRGKLS